ncbi:MAG TPA: FAD-dependent oxidoreductase [Woeseiaceae bacterium]|nr:FAD-dependent oxidoreductase [Woeseiaceae bacterium]
MPETLVIVGGGHAAGQAIASLRQQKYRGRIVLLGEETHPPYQRPPLSKKFLAGELSAERLYVKPAAFYDAPDIDVRPGTRVTGIDRDRGAVTTEDGLTVAWDALLIATGSRVRRLPGDETLPAGIHYLRNIADVDAIRADFAVAKRLVIVGAGYIGLEVAAVARTLGLDVTVLEMAGRVMSRVVSPAVSAFYESVHRAQGVDLRLNTGLAGFAGRPRVRAVVTAAGDEIPADVVVVGVGIVPNVELAAAAGLEVDDGIVVDAGCRTSDPRIYAIGDCTSHPSAIYGRRVRLESVPNALEQARTAAGNLCGGRLEHAEVPWFWSDQYDLKLQIAGLSQGYDSVIVRGSPADRAFSCLYLRDGRLLAIDAVNTPRDFMQAKALIASRAHPDPARAADAASPLKGLAG